MAVDWNAVRAEFPALQNWTFLNTATFGQLSRRATDAVARHFARRDALACADFLDWFDDADRIRALAARLIHADASDIAFVNNASTALGLLLGGLDLKPGDHLVTLEHEFPNNLYYPALLAQRGIEFAEVSHERLEQAITPRTRLVLMSTANYITGYRPPLAEISRMLRDRGVLLYLDGTQSLGAFQLDVREVRPAMLVAHGYKWLLAPNGAGLMYVGPELRERLAPNVIGWRSDRRWREVDNLHHGAPEPASGAEKYEGGMLNFPSLYGLGASLEMMLEIGPAEIEARVLELAQRARRVLEDQGARVLHRDTAILAAHFPGRDPSRLAESLKRERIQVSARHGNLRVSVHFYNNEEDLERCQDALRCIRDQ